MINIQNLRFGYKKKKILFEDLTLDLKPGNIYGLLGKNGAGKTTLLKIMSGLRFPFSGMVEVMGYSPRKRHYDFLKSLSFLPEEFYTPSIPIKTYEKIYSPFYPKFNTSQFRKNCEEFELTLDTKISSLSMGQKKKLLIAFALATNTRLLLLDEPTNGLDIPSKSQFRKMVAAALEEDKIIIISTHQVRDVENLIDPIIILDNGSIIFHHSLEDVSKHLHFSVQHKAPEKDVLYSEKTMQGHLVIRSNTSNEDSLVHLEPLFNVVTYNYSIIEKLFHGENQ